MTWSFVAGVGATVTAPAVSSPTLVGATGSVYSTGGDFGPYMLTHGKPSGTAAGDALVLVAIGYTSVSNPIISAPAGFTRIAAPTAIGTGYQYEIWQKLATSSEPSSYVFDITAAITTQAFPVATLFAIRGIHPEVGSYAAVAAIAGAVFDATSWAIPNQTSVSSQDFVLTVVLDDDANIAHVTYPSGTAISITGGDAKQVAGMSARYQVATSAGQTINDGPVTWAGNTVTGAVFAVLFYGGPTWSAAMTCPTVQTGDQLLYISGCPAAAAAAAGTTWTPLAPLASVPAGFTRICSSLSTGATYSIDVWGKVASAADSGTTLTFGYSDGAHHVHGALLAYHPGLANNGLWTNDGGLAWLEGIADEGAVTVSGTCSDVDGSHAAAAFGSTSTYTGLEFCLAIALCNGYGGSETTPSGLTKRLAHSATLASLTTGILVYDAPISGFGPAATSASYVSSDTSSSSGATLVMCPR